MLIGANNPSRHMFALDDLLILHAYGVDNLSENGLDLIKRVRWVLNDIAYLFHVQIIDDYKLINVALYETGTSMLPNNRALFMHISFAVGLLACLTKAEM